MNLNIQDLQIAWEQVRRGSKVAGIDDITVDMFAGVLSEQLYRLQRHLQKEHYLASPAKGFFVPKKNGGSRLIGIPTVTDRIVQRGLLHRIYPQLEESLSPCCYAYRPGLSIYSAIRDFAELYQQQPAWVVKTDIEAFFDNLSWPLLMSQVEQSQVPSELSRLLEQQLKAGLILSGSYFNPGKGVLQGGVLSGALANLYLREFDYRCLNSGINLFRYGDDCVVVCSSWLEANRTLTLMQDWLEDCYLTLKAEKTSIFAPHEEFTFLGHHCCNGVITPPIRSVGSKKESREAPRVPRMRRPLVCSITKPKSKTKRRIEPYWREPMTTLYITEQGAYLKVKNQQFQVICEQQLRCNVPVNRVDYIIMFGCCNVSHAAVSLALRRRIPILYLSNNGKYFGRLETAGQARVDYLTQQVGQSQDPDFVRRQAESIVLAKLHNSRIVLMRLNRRRQTDCATEVIKELSELMTKVPHAESLDQLRGYEGHGANLYFQAYGTLLKGKFQFEKRNRRPPTDPVNSLLSLGYTLLHQNVASIIQVVGLHTHYGNLHTPRRNHPALVSDLVEEFRSPIVDSLVAYLINTNIFKEDDFTPPDERGGVYLHPHALKKFLKHWEERMQTEIKHPVTEYKVSYRRCLELQVWEYIECLQGKQDCYRAMRWEK